MAKCPICEARGDRPTVDALVETGGDLQAVKSLLRDRGLECSVYWIKKHFREHTRISPEILHESLLQKVQPTKAEREAEAADRKKRNEEVKEYLDNVATIDLDRVLGKIGVDSKVQSMDDVLTLVQKFSIGLHTMTSAIAFDRLERYMRDPEGRKYPGMELKGASMTSQMVSEAFGYQQMASLQTAVDTVEKSGYRVVESGMEKSGNQLPESE
jgi:hypothetical protein